MFFPVIVRTAACYTDGSLLESEENRSRYRTILVYAATDNRQQAEDLTRDWLSDLSDAARVYTPEGTNRRRLVSVVCDVYDTPAVVKPPKGKFLITNGSET